MTSDLKQLLNDSAAHAPAEPHSVNDIVRNAQRHQRRHTMGVVGGSILALALVAGVGYAALVRNGADDAQPVVHKLEHGVTMTIDKRDLKEARQLVPGKDYDVLAELSGADVPVRSWSPDDLIIVKKGEEHAAVTGLDGAETVVTGHPANRYAPMAAGDDHVVWSDNDDEGHLMVQDLLSGKEHELSLSLDGLDDLSSVTTYQVSIEKERVWALFPADGLETEALVSVSAPLDGSSGFRRELDTTVTEAVVADGNLVWTEGKDAPLMVRDLDSGEVSQIADGLGRKCRFSVTGVTRQRVATTPQCSGKEGSWSMPSNATVWSLVGGPTIKLPGNTRMFGGLADDRVLFQPISKAGLTTYAYSFETGEVIDLGTVAIGTYGAQLDWQARASGDRLTFPSPDRKGHVALVVLK